MEAGWDALAVLPLSAGGNTRLGTISRIAEGLEAAGSLLGRKYFLAKGVSCTGANSTARRWLGDLSLALWDRQHPQCTEKHLAAACTGQAPEHAQLHPCPPTTRRQLDIRLCAGAISAGLKAMSLPCWEPWLWTCCTTLHQASCWGTDRCWPCKNSPQRPGGELLAAGKSGKKTPLFITSPEPWPGTRVLT